jgi:ferredoxin
MYIVVAIFVTTCNLFGASSAQNWQCGEYISYSQLKSEMGNQFAQMNQDVDTWRHSTPAHRCCYYAGNLCTLCGPCVAGCAQSIIESEREFDETEQMCSLDILPLKPIIVGFAAGTILNCVFSYLYRPDQSKRWQYLKTLQDAWIKQNLW